MIGKPYDEFVELVQRLNGIQITHNSLRASTFKLNSDFIDILKRLQRSGYIHDVAEGGIQFSIETDEYNALVHAAEYDELVLTIGSDKKKKKEVRRAMKLLKEEGDRILNKIW